MDYNLALLKEILTQAVTRTNLEDIVLSEGTDRKRTNGARFHLREVLGLMGSREWLPRAGGWAR